MTSILPEYIRCGSFDSGENVRFHDHPGTELIYVTEGNCIVEAAGMPLSAPAGTLLVIPPDTPHNQINSGRVVTSYVIFGSTPMFDDRPRSLSLTDDVWVAHWLNEIFTLQQEAHEHMMKLGTGLLYLILQRLTEIETAGQCRTAYPEPLVKAVNFIERNYTSGISLSDVAGKAGICPEYLCSLFHKHLQRSPMSHIMELRLKHAAQLLGDPYLSIKEISSRCGFNDANYFSRRFRRYFGQSPAAARTSTRKPSPRSEKAMKSQSDAN